MAKKTSVIVDPITGASREYEGRWCLNSVTKEAKFEEAEAGTTTVFACGLVIRDPAGKLESVPRQWRWREMFWTVLVLLAFACIKLLARATT